MSVSVHTTTAEKRTRGITLPYLRAWRQRKGLSQRELSEMSTLGGKEKPVQYSQISRIEAGQPATPHTIARLAEALGINRETLITVDPDKAAPADETPRASRKKTAQTA